MKVMSRFGNRLDLIGWERNPDDTISDEYAIAIRLDDKVKKTYHISDLCSEGGTSEIIEMLNKIEKGLL